MKQAVRARAIRLMAASLLASDISTSDLRDVARELELDMGRDLADLLRGLSFGLMSNEPPPKSPPPNEASASKLYSVAQRRRIPKSQVIEYIEIITGHTISEGMDATLRQLLEAFVKSATSSQKSQLEQMMSGNSSDPYLQGILKRNS